MVILLARPYPGGPRLYVSLGSARSFPFQSLVEKPGFEQADEVNLASGKMYIEVQVYDQLQFTSNEVELPMLGIN